MKAESSCKQNPMNGSISLFGLNIFISFLQLYKHINIYINNTSYGIRTEAKSL